MKWVKCITFNLNQKKVMSLLTKNVQFSVYNESKSEINSYRVKSLSKWAIQRCQRDMFHLFIIAKVSAEFRIVDLFAMLVMNEKQICFASIRISATFDCCHSYSMFTIETKWNWGLHSKWNRRETYWKCYFLCCVPSIWYIQWTI